MPAYPPFFDPADASFYFTSKTGARGRMTRDALPSRIRRNRNLATVAKRRGSVFVRFVPDSRFLYAQTYRRSYRSTPQTERKQTSSENDSQIDAKVRTANYRRRLIRERFGVCSCSSEFSSARSSSSLAFSLSFCLASF